MVGPRYSQPQIRARVAALEIAAEYLGEQVPADPVEAKQFNDIILKLLNERTRLKAQAQEKRKRAQ